MPDVTIYSIDEAFIDLTSMRNSFDIYQPCVALAQKIEKWTGIPVSIGIAPTKTLAKVANDVAKKQGASSVYYFDTEQKIKTVLNNFKIRDVWGIGRQLEKKLHTLGIYTAAELMQLPEVQIKNTFNITTQRTILELRGISCISLKNNSKNKQQIMVSRSFGYRVTKLPELNEAIATYASMACEKLRTQHSITDVLYVLLQTGLHGDADATYRNSIYITLPAHTADTRLIIQAAKGGLAKLFQAGFRYQKVGIILCDLVN